MREVIFVPGRLLKSIMWSSIGQNSGEVWEIEEKDRIE